MLKIFFKLKKINLRKKEVNFLKFVICCDCDFIAERNIYSWT